MSKKAKPENTKTTDDATTVPVIETATKEIVATEEKLGYRLLTGKDDRSFCERVSNALKDGYVLPYFRAWHGLY